ncbi:MAG: type II toxin-antitoxin system VapC family toxin [Spirochaetaceae bacterium]|jgi:predicted nucleic acid-binding protein|nr:type II toxin-antitoxin system VapC family toxin [Spirochaetaceae bacterium]
MYVAEKVIDASAIMAIILNEPSRDKVIAWTRGAALVSPEMIDAEIGNGLINLFRRHKIAEADLLTAYQRFTEIPLRKVNAGITGALKIACRYGIFAYDAYYLEAASRLGLPLVTLDGSMAQTGRALKLDVCGKE